MKKIVSLLLGLLMVFAACMAIAETVTAKPGDELAMTVRIEDASGKSAKVGLNTNSSPVTFVKAVGGKVNDVVPPQAFDDCFGIINDDGITISADGKTISGEATGPIALVDGVIGTVTFKVNDDAEPGTYTVEATKKSGSVTVVGSVTFVIEEEEISDKLLGDVNGDGKIDGRDQVRLMRYLVAMDEEDPVVSVTIVEVNSDMNEDGKFDGRDSVRLMKLLVELDDE